MSRALRVALLLGLAVLCPASLAAQTTELLATGPDKGRGIPYIGPNVIAYYSASYRRASEKAPATVGSAGPAVLYTGTAVVPQPSWGPAPCGTPSMLSVEAKPAVLFYRSPSGWCLFLSFPAGYAKPCAFAAAFVERFIYFLGITQDSPLSSFPAVLRVP